MKKAALILAVLIFLSACTKEEQKFRATFFDTFDTVTEIVAYSKSEEDFEKTAALLNERLIFYHRLFDIYNSYDGINNLKTINDNAGIAPVTVDSEIIDFLLFCRDVYYETSHTVNIAMGSVLSLWKSCAKKGIVPQKSLLEAAAEHISFESVLINPEESTVFITDCKTRLDVGSIAKGYAAQKCVDYARSLGIENALISVGGNVCVLGEKKGGSDWKISIKDPFEGKEEQVCAKNMSVITSGSYERFYTVGNKSYGHIIDPETLMPPESFKSVTVICPSSAKGDAFSTALFVMSLKDGMDFVSSKENTEAMWVTNDGNRFFSSGFKDFLSE